MMPHSLPHRPQAGIALILVLWIISLLTVIALSFIATMRSEINIVANTVHRARAEAIADAAIQRALWEILKPATVTGRWTADGRAHRWSYRDAAIIIRVKDETAKIDINTANPELLRGLFLSQGLGTNEALALIDAMADWKDADSLKRLNGAEEAEYLAAGLAYKPANAPFQSIEELNRVLGMTPALFARIASLITVYSRQPGVNVQIASREVLRAIPNASDEQIELYLQQRELARAGNAPMPGFAPATAFLSGGSGAIRVSAQANLPDGTQFVREAVVMLRDTAKRPYAFLLWKEGRDVADADTGPDALDSKNAAFITPGSQATNDPAVSGAGGRVR